MWHCCTGYSLFLHLLVLHFTGVGRPCGRLLSQVRRPLGRPTAGGRQLRRADRPGPLHSAAAAAGLPRPSSLAAAGAGICAAPGRAASPRISASGCIVSPACKAWARRYQQEGGSSTRGPAQQHEQRPTAGGLPAGTCRAAAGRQPGCSGGARAAVLGLPAKRQQQRGPAGTPSAAGRLLAIAAACAACGRAAGPAPAGPAWGRRRQRVRFAGACSRSTGQGE